MNSMSSSMKGFLILVGIFGIAWNGIKLLPPTIPSGIIERGEQVLYAVTPEEQIAGLAGKEAKGLKMLFVFDDESVRCLWSPDNPVAVKAAFFTSTGKAAGSTVLLPRNRTPYCSQPNVRYILETVL